MGKVHINQNKLKNIIMSIGTTIVGLVAFLLMISPIFYLNWQKGKKRRKLESRLIAEGSEYGLSIDEKEYWHDTIIACDSVNKAILYGQKTSTGPAVEIVKLEDVAKCEPVTIATSVPTSNGSQKVIEKLALRITFKSSQKSDMMLDIYDSNLTIQLENEIAIMNEWNKKINTLIRQSKAS